MGEKKKSRKKIYCEPEYIVKDVYTEKEVIFVHPIIRIKKEHIKYVPRHVYKEESIHEIIDPGFPKCDCKKKKKKEFDESSSSSSSSKKHVESSSSSSPIKKHVESSSSSSPIKKHVESSSSSSPIKKHVESSSSSSSSSSKKKKKKKKFQDDIKDPGFPKCNCKICKKKKKKNRW